MLVGGWTWAWARELVMAVGCGFASWRGQMLWSAGLLEIYHQSSLSSRHAQSSVAAWNLATELVPLRDQERALLAALVERVDVAKDGGCP